MCGDSAGFRILCIYLDRRRIYLYLSYHGGFLRFHRLFSLWCAVLVVRLTAWAQLYFTALARYFEVLLFMVRSTPTFKQRNLRQRLPRHSQSSFTAGAIPCLHHHVRGLPGGSHGGAGKGPAQDGLRRSHMFKVGHQPDKGVHWLSGVGWWPAVRCVNTKLDKGSVFSHRSYLVMSGQGPAQARGLLGLCKARRAGAIR